MPEPEAYPAFLTGVKPLGGLHAGVPQRPGGHEDPVGFGKLRAVLFSQHMDWIVAGDAMFAKPVDKLFEQTLATVILVLGSAFWQKRGFDYELALSLRVEPSKQCADLRIHVNVIV